MEARLSQKEQINIGWREWVTLPDLGVDAIKAKIDTGARTSALHAYRIERFRHAGALWLPFELHPMQRSEATKVACEARAIDKRTVRNSGGGIERRSPSLSKVLMTPSPDRRGCACTRARHRDHQYAACVDQYHLAASGSLLPQAAARRFRGGDPAERPMATDSFKGYTPITSNCRSTARP